MAEKAEAVQATTEYIEYMGEEPYGVAFLTSHTLPKADPLWKQNKVTDAKEVVWMRDPQGPGIGQQGSRMLVRVDDLPGSMVAVLEKTPGYRRVSV